MAEENGDTSLEVKRDGISIKGKKTAELITILSLCLLFLMAYVLWEHKGDAKSQSEALVEMMRAMVQAQREQNCLIAIRQEERENKAEFCKRISR